MTARTSISRLADEAPVPAAQPTPTEMAAVIFVKEMAAHVDEKHGMAPTRGTQKKVAAVVRENFFTPTASARSWPARRPPSFAYAAACAAFEMQARRSILREIKNSARYYARHPGNLDAIEPGLSYLKPRGLYLALRSIAMTARTPRWFAFGGEIQAINLRGGMLYARWSRRVWNRRRRQHDD